MTELVVTPDGGDAYHVMLAGGQLRVFSLDELDEAFNAGSIDERTFVLPPGSTEWTRLGDLAGLEGDQAPPPAAPVMAAAPMMAAAPPAPSRAPQAFAPASVAPASYAPAPVLSTRPVSMDLDFDLPDDALKPKRRAPVFVTVALLALGGGGFFAFKHMPRQSDAAATAAAAAAAVQVAPPPASTTPTPTFAPTDTRPALTDEQRKALLDADKVRAAKVAASRAAKAAAAPKHHGKRSKEKVFNNGGSAYDPLNGSL